MRLIPFNQPTLTGREQDYLAEVLASQKFSGDGPFSNIKGLLIEHTGEALETQYRTEIEGRKGRFKGSTVEDGFKDFLERKGRKPRVS